MKRQTTIPTWAMVALLSLAAVALLPVRSVAGVPSSLSDYRPAVPATSAGQTATLLPDGRWLLLGGLVDGQATDSAQILDRTSGDVKPLKAHLLQVRAWHTATVLPDGNVFIYGGVDQSGISSSSAEIFDPATDSFAMFPNAGLSARSHHNVTLLTSGQLLIAGGTARGDVLLFETASEKIIQTANALEPSRDGASSALLANGQVLIWGGVDAQGRDVPDAVVFNPADLGFGALAAFGTLALPEAPSNAALTVAASIPGDQAGNVPVSSRIAVRFSKFLDVTSMNAGTVTLIGPSGKTAARVVGTNNGQQLFVTPAADLMPGSHYTLFMNGLTAGEKTMPFTAIDFTTEAILPSDQGDGPWIPTADQLRGNWRVKEQDSPWIHQPPLQAGPGVTALAGQVLKLNGQPLPNATLVLGKQSVQTDKTGRFLLTGIPSGSQVLTIDARTASQAANTYGLYQAKVDVAAGRTTALDYTVWMTALDTRDAIDIPSPTMSEVVITNPLIPNLELRIPAGTVIRGLDGKIVTHVSITPVPVNRPPFPLPNIHVPVYFTVQPGGAMLQAVSAADATGARLIYPNFDHQPPGGKVNFWNYDAHDKGWYVYGPGTISANALQAVPDPGVVIYEFSGAMIADPQNGAPPVFGPPCPEEICSQGADPVDLATGLFTYRQTDLYLPDVMPIAVTRSYNGGDKQPRAFGINTNFDYGMFLYSAGGGGTAPTDLYLPDGSDIKFTCISGCASYTTAVLQAQTTATKFYLSTVRYQTAIQFGYSLTLLDGTAYYFLGEAFASHELAAIVDRYGNQVTVTGNGAPITKVTSPNGRWFTFSYTNPSFPNYITSATDSAGRTVTYTYDAIGRLSTVVDANGGVTTYTYDSSNRILSVKDPKGITYVTNVYNSYGQVIQQTLGDGTSKYQLAYTPSTGGLATQTNVTDPNGNVRSVQFNANGYPASETTAYGTSLAQTTTYVRGVAGNPNLLQSVTDALNRTTAYAYDTIGNVSTVTRLSGTAGATTWSFTREPLFQRLQTITDPLGHVTSFAYDGAARLSQVSDSLNHVTSFAYDNEARVMSSIDSLNHIQSYQYQGPDLVSVTNALGHTNRRFADAAGRTLALTDPMGGQTLYTYDKNNNVLTMTNPVAGMTSLTYDLDNNLLSVTSPNSRTTTYTYNNLGQRTGQTDPLGHGDLYVFDSLGNLTQHTDRKGQITWSSYDALSRLNQITYSGGSTLGLTWDAANRVISLADSINGVVTRAYDGLDRLTQEVTPQGTVNYAYDADNRETSLSVMGGTAVTYGYDAGNRLLSVSQGSSAVSLAYDNVNRLTSLTLPDGVVATYGYDNGNELTSLSYAMGATNIDSMTYGYDSVGRNNHFVSALNQLTNAVTPVSACSYDGADEMLTFGSITTPTYDANGNLTGDGTNTYTWNSRNQLVSISGGVSASFTYDAVGRRASRTVNGITTTFVHDRANLVSEAIGANTAAYLTGPALDQVFSRTDSSGQMSYLRDGSGSILGLADPSGALVTQYNYEPYGNTSTSGASSSNPLQYAGRENDGTGLYFDRARYYRPAIGRFVSQDPIGFAGGINEYAYVGGNPIQFMDPTGLGETEFSGTLGTGAAVTGSIAYNSDTGMVTVGLGVGYGLGASGSVSYTGSAPAGSEGESSGVRGVTITPFVRASGELGSAEVEAESTSKGGEITGTLPLGPLGFGGKYDMSDGTLLPRTTEGFGASGGLFGGGKISFPLPSLGGGKQRNPGTDVGNNPDDEGGVCQSSAGFSNC